MFHFQKKQHRVAEVYDQALKLRILYRIEICFLSRKLFCCDQVHNSNEFSLTYKISCTSSLAFISKLLWEIIAAIIAIGNPIFNVRYFRGDQDIIEIYLSWEGLSI